MELSLPHGWFYRNRKRSPLTEPKEYLHKIGIFLDAQAARTLGLQSGVVVRQHTTPEDWARQALSLSADEARRVRESIEDCGPCQEAKLDW